MKRTTRLTAGLAATVALAAPSALATAQAAPPTTVKSQTKQLLKDIAGKDFGTSQYVELAARSMKGVRPCAALLEVEADRPRTKWR